MKIPTTPVISKSNVCRISMKSQDFNFRLSSKLNTILEWNLIPNHKKSCKSNEKCIKRTWKGILHSLFYFTTTSNSTHSYPSLPSTNHQSSLITITTFNLTHHSPSPITIIAKKDCKGYFGRLPYFSFQLCSYIL